MCSCHAILKNQAFVHLERLRFKMTNDIVLESRQIGDWVVGDSKIKAWISKQLMRFMPPSYLVESFAKFDQPNLDTIAEARKAATDAVAADARVGMEESEASAPSC